MKCLQHVSGITFIEYAYMADSPNTNLYTFKHHENDIMCNIYWSYKHVYVGI